VLTQTQIDSYRRDGFVFPVPALADAALRGLRTWLAEFEAAHADTPARERRETMLRFKPHLLHPMLDRVIRTDAILDAVAGLIGPDIAVWASAFFIKDAHDPSFVSWHQDSATYGLAGEALVTAWIALTDVDAGNAAMRFAPGSHRAGPRAHRDTQSAHNMLSRGETLDDIDEAGAVDVALPEGAMSLHNIHLAHSSRANSSDRPRIGYAVRYCSPAMQPMAGPASVLMVRGRDRYGHFEHETAPGGEDDPAALAMYRHAIGLRTATVFRHAHG
jgi:hypothetical protein